MRRFSVVGGAFVVLGLGVACSSKGTELLPSDGDAGATSSQPTAASFDMQVRVAAGQETTKCKYVQMPSDEQYLTRLTHEYSPGSHHLLLFRTSVTTFQPGMDQIVDCGGANETIMSTVRGILYGSQEPKGEATLPAGVALHTDPGEVLLMQTHYLNAGDKDIDARVDVRLYASPPDSIQYRAGVIFFYDPFISVPARGTASASMRCLVSKDIKLLGGFSHMHKRGTGLTAFLDTDKDKLTATPFYESRDWEHPNSIQGPLEVKAGSRIRFSCKFDNASGDREYVQGPSAETNEMCLLSGMYYPQMGQSDDFCLTDPDMLGTGAATCAQSLDCVRKCPPGEKGSGGPASIPPCIQRCMVGSCPTASRVLTPALTCVRQTCKAECADPQAQGCLDCVTQKCKTQYDACNVHACQ